MFKEALEQHYGFLFEPPLMKEILAYGSLKKVAPGQQLIEIGEIISHMPLLLSGAIKIMREDDQGDELLLYFIEKGDTCAMSFSCCMGGTKSDIRAIAETDAEIIMVPVAQMEQWMAKYKTWQQFVLDSYHARMKELLHTVDTLAFLRMDDRLLKHLQDKAKVTGDDHIHATHQEIAYDLHTSRVVISRLLKKLENEGKISMHRNDITVIDL